MDVDASERRKIKIYAGQKKKKTQKKTHNEEIFPTSHAQLECCGGSFGIENFYLQIMCL